MATGRWRSLTYALRSAVPLSLPAIKRVVTYQRVLSGLTPRQRARVEALAARGHDLEAWGWRCSAQEWRESLYALDLWCTIADAGLVDGLPDGRALDVGSKNGAYLAGLATAVPRGWDAVELDAHRRYLWGSTRRVYGEAIARTFAGCRFVAGDVRDLPGPWAVATWLLPFLTEVPHRAWGLPDALLAPEAVLDHVVDRLVPGAALVIVNQGIAESELQRALLRTRPLDVTPVVAPSPALSPFVQPRFTVVGRKR